MICRANQLTGFYTMATLAFSELIYYNNLLQFNLLNLRALLQYQVQLLKVRKVSTKKAAGIDSILPKLVKLAAERLCQPLTEAKNTCIKQNNFPNNSKVAFPVPLDKGKSNKHDMSNLF